MADSKKSSIATNTIHLLNLKTPDRTGKRLKLSFQRTRGMITVLKSSKRVEVSLSLLDITETGVGFFSEQLLLKGSTIELLLSEPKVLRLLGLVAWSVPIKSGIHQAKFGFRSGMQFQFENEIQRSALIDFIQRVAIEPAEQFKSQLASKAAESAAVASAATAIVPPNLMNPMNPDNEYPPPGVTPNANAPAGVAPVGAAPAAAPTTPAATEPAASAAAPSPAPATPVQEATPAVASTAPLAAAPAPEAAPAAPVEEKKDPAASGDNGQGQAA